MLTRKYLKFCFEIIFILIVIAGGLNLLENRKYGRIYDADEVAWIFAGYYFNLYFLRFDLFHPDWNDYEAFDHPPLAKYIVGGSLYLRGYTIDSLDPKKFWNNIPLTEFPKYFELVKDKIPNPGIVIPTSRSVIFVFALSSLLLIYIFVRISYGVLPAFISTSLIMCSPIFNRVSIWILAEPILLFFYALFILICGLYLKSQKSIYVVLASIVSSLAFLTKVNGILLVFVLIVLFLVNNKFVISKRDWKFVITGFIVFLLISLLLNPVFLNRGIKAIGDMVEVRLSAFRVYQETFKDVALLSMSERFVAAIKMIFFGLSPFYKLIKVPVELIMFVGGFYYTLRRRDLLLILIFTFLVVIPISILPHNTPRYYYWIFPFTYIIAGLSVNLFKEILGGRDVGYRKIQERTLYLSGFIAKLFSKAERNISVR